MIQVFYIGGLVPWSIVRLEFHTAVVRGDSVERSSGTRPPRICMRPRAAQHARPAQWHVCVLVASACVYAVVYDGVAEPARLEALERNLAECIATEFG